MPVYLIYLLLLGIPSNTSHLHRLIGSRAMAAMHQAKILYHESSPSKKLNIEFAKQNFEDMKRIVGTFERNLKLLYEISPEEEKKLIEAEIKGMNETADLLEEKIYILEEELEADKPDQYVINELSKELYWLFKQMLDYHVTAEKKLGIEPPPEVPK